MNKHSTKKPRRPIGPRSKVLVIMQVNGLIEVYAANNIDVHFVNRLFVGDESAEEANLIDDYTTGTMPRPYRELYWPNKMRGLGFHEKVTPEQAADALYQKSILRGLQANRPAPAAIVKARGPR